MGLRIHLPAKGDPVHMFIDAPADGGEGRDYLFKEGRVIPVYCYYPGERRGYVLCCEGTSCGPIPNVEGGYKILLAVRGPEVERLEKAVRKLYLEIGSLESIPEAFWPKLGLLVSQRSFRVYMVTELCLATQQLWQLRVELSAASDNDSSRPTNSLRPIDGVNPKA